MSNTVGNTLSVRDYQRMLKRFRKDPIWGNTSKYHKNLVIKSVCKALERELKVSWGDSRHTIYLNVVETLGKSSAWAMIDVFGPRNGEFSPTYVVYAIAHHVAFNIYRFLGTV